MADDDLSGLIVIPENASPETLRTVVSQMFRSQVTQSRALERQGRLIANQQHLSDNILNQVSQILVIVRGPDDTTQPGLVEKFRNAQERLDKQELTLEDQRARLILLERQNSKLKTTVESLQKTEESRKGYLKEGVTVLLALIVTAVWNFLASGGFG